MVDKINSINRFAAGMLSNTRNSTPRAALEVMYELIPIPLVIKREALGIFCKEQRGPKRGNPRTCQVTFKEMGKICRSMATQRGR